MSLKQMVYALGTKVGNPIRKLVLVKLADNANDYGECWPSYDYIASECEISKRSVIRHISNLSKSGLMRKQIRKGPNGNTSNRYVLTLERGKEGSEGVTDGHPRGDRESPGGCQRGSDLVTESHPEPINEPINEPEEEAQWLCKQTWTEFLEHRKSLKSPMTCLAKKKMIKKLDQLRRQGHDPSQLLEDSIINGWRGVFPPKQEKKKPSQAWGDHMMVDFDAVVREEREQERRKAQA